MSTIAATALAAATFSVSVSASLIGQPEDRGAGAGDSTEVARGAGGGGEAPKDAVHIGPRAALLAEQRAMEPFPRRAWGLGLTFAGVGAATQTLVLTDPGVFDNFLAVNTPTLEARAFLKRGDSIDVSVPLINAIVFSTAARGFGLGADVYYSFERGRGVTRLLIGPGLGVAMSFAPEHSLGALRVVGQAGLELVPRGSKYSFQLLGRPWFALIPGSYTGASAASDPAPYGGGVLFVLGLVVYRLKHEQEAERAERARRRATGKRRRIWP